MEYKLTFIPPEGRNKYGNYLADSNITRMVVNYENGGQIVLPKDEEETKVEEKRNYAIALSSSNGQFEYDDITANLGQTNSINVVGYGDLITIPTYVGDITINPTNENDVASNRNYDVKGLVSGMTIEVHNNGTTATTIDIKVSPDINMENKKGTLYIPCSIYVGPDEQAPYLPNTNPSTGEYIEDIDTAQDYSDWNGVKDQCKTLWLEYNYVIVMNASNNYILELSNELAGINCDITGVILSGQNLSCKAYLYYGSSLVETATYGLAYSQYQNVQGISINTTTGEVIFGNDFKFDGTNIEISIWGTDGNYTSTKIMNINKIYPGKDGAGSVNYWIVPSTNIIEYNPNNNSLSHSTISAKVFKQIDNNPAEEDNNITIYYGWDTDNPANIYSGPIQVEAAKNYISFALRTQNNQIFEIETIPIIKDGKNGEKGESTYTLLLTNTNASINCDINGNILPTAIRPNCEAYLYYGTEDVSENILFQINPSINGLSFSGQSLVYGENFSFDGDALEVNIVAMDKTNLNFMTKGIMNITKTYPGKDGEHGADAISYWVEPSDNALNCFMVNSDNVVTPISIKFNVYKQIGGNLPEEMNADEYYLSYSKNQITAVSTLPSSRTINFESDANYYKVFLALKNPDGSVTQYIDEITIPVLRDGKRGAEGPKGPTLRGPVDYNKINSPRRFCSGIYPDATISDSQAGDAEWIDIISIQLPGEQIRRKYKCVHSYTWSSTDIENWDNVKDNWIEATEYDFVATEVLLADQANIANFVFSNNKLISQAKDENGNPLLELDGLNGIIKAEKGIFKGNTWYNFKIIDQDTALKTLNPEESTNVILVQNIDNTSLSYVQLPTLTKEIDGCKFFLLWNNLMGSRVDGKPCILYANKRRDDLSSEDFTYIYDSEFMYPKNSVLERTGEYYFKTGSGEQKFFPFEVSAIDYEQFPLAQITFMPGTLGFIEIIANYQHNAWIITNRSKNGFGAVGPASVDRYVRFELDSEGYYTTQRKWSALIGQIGGTSLELGTKVFDLMNSQHVKDMFNFVFRPCIKQKNTF